MMRFWISRGSSTPIGEQLSAQLLLGILSRKFAPGSRLPSVRELARRLQIHPNTVSTTYGDLARRGWVESRHGSGVFVARRPGRSEETGIDAFVTAWLDDARKLGFSLVDLQSALARANPGHHSPRALLVVDPDPELARVIAAELAEATGRPVNHAGCDETARTRATDSTVLVNAGRESDVAAFLGATALRTVRVRSMQDFVAGHQRPATPILIAVVSRSQSILDWASTLLSALGFPADAVLLRNPSLAAWQEGLSMCGIIGVDLVAAKDMPPEIRAVVFRIVDPGSLDEFRDPQKSPFPGVR